MSSKKSEPLLHIEPRSSRQLATIMLLMHGAAMAIVINLNLPIWLVLGLAGSIIVLLFSTWNLYILNQNKKSLKVMIWDEEGSWTLITADKKPHAATLLSSSFIFPKMIVLQFLAKNPRKKYSTVIMQDSLPANIFRQLFVRLRLEFQR